MTDNYTYLKNNSPSTASELPKDTGGTSRKDRRRGMQKFKITTGHGNHVSGVGHTQTPVYYIDGEHAPKQVLEAWKAANQNAVENVNARSLHQKIATNKNGFTEASREVFGPFESYAHGEYGDGSTDMGCPFCGDDTIQSFPTHRSDCPEL